MSANKSDHADPYKNFYDIWQKTMSEAIEMLSKNPMLDKDKAPSAANIDPQEYYKKFYETWEKSSSEMLESWVNSPLFASSMGKALEQSSDFKKYFDEMIDKTLSNLRMPSKNDIDNVLRSIHTLEAKINDLSDKVDDLSKPARKKK